MPRETKEQQHARFARDMEIEGAIMRGEHDIAVHARAITLEWIKEA